MKQNNNTKLPEAGRKTLLIMLSCSFLAAAACADKAVELRDGGSGQGDAAIGFVVDRNITRGAPVTGLAGLADIGVYGYYTGYERWEWSWKNAPGELSTEGYFCNERLEQAAGWTYSPLRYWPVDPRRKLSFFAYSPYSAGGSAAILPSPADSSVKGVPAITYTVPADIKEQSDLMWDAAIDRDADHRDVDFRMKHALTAMTFTAALANQDEVDENYTVTVDKISVSPVHASGTLDLTYGTWRFGTDNPAGDEFIIEGSGLSGYVLGADVDSHNLLSPDAGALMLIPQDVSGVYLTFTLRFDNGSGDITTAPVTYNLGQIGMPWEAGNSINYELKIRAKFITIQTTMQPWPANKQSTGEVLP